MQSFPTFLLGEKALAPHNYVVSDDIVQFLPWLDYSRRTLLNGELPLWNPLNAGGRPLFGNMQSGLLNPVNWPELVVGEHLGMLIKAFLNLYLAAFFSFLFFRKLNANVLAALAGAVAVEFMGFQVIWLTVALLATFAVFPLMLYLVERKMQGGSNTFFVTGLAFAVAWEIFAGHPETIFLNTLAVSAYLVFRLATEKRVWGGLVKRLKIFGLYVTGGILGTLLGTVQLLPFVEYLLNSYIYSHRITAKSYAIDPIKAITMLLPNPYGNPIYRFTVEADFSFPNYNEISGGYVGPIVIFLALLGLWVIRRKPITWFVAGFSVFGLGVVYGIWPFYQLITSIPIALAYHRLLGYVALFLITLMVLCLHELLARTHEPVTKQQIVIEPAENTEPEIKFTPTSTRPPRRWTWALPGGLGLVFLAVMTLAFWLFSQSGEVPFSRESVRIIEWQEFAFIAGLFAAGVVFLTLALRWRRWQALFVGLLIVAIFGQLGLFGRVYRAAIDSSLYYPQTATLQALEQNAGRMVVSGPPSLMPAEVNLMYNIDQIYGYDAIEVRWFNDLRDASENRWPTWDNPVPLNLFNIKQVMASSYDPNFQGIVATNTDQLRRQSKQRALNIYVNTKYQPQYRVVYSAVVQSEKQLEQNLVEGKIDTLTQVGFIQGSEPDVLPSGGFESVALPPSPEVKIVSKSNNKAVLQLKNDQPGYLYIDQTYFPGWTAKINGQDAELYRANYAFTALPIPTGQLTIELEYSPWSIKAGGILNLVTLLGIGCFYLVRRVRRRSAPKPEKKPTTV